MNSGLFLCTAFFTLFWDGLADDKWLTHNRLSPPQLKNNMRSYRVTFTLPASSLLKQKTKTTTKIYKLIKLFERHGEFSFHFCQSFRPFLYIRGFSDICDIWYNSQPTQSTRECCLIEIIEANTSVEQTKHQHEYSEFFCLLYKILIISLKWKYPRSFKEIYLYFLRRSWTKLEYSGIFWNL